MILVLVLKKDEEKLFLKNIQMRVPLSIFMLHVILFPDLLIKELAGGYWLRLLPH